jgi:hypothetical protein
MSTTFAGTAGMVARPGRHSVPEPFAEGLSAQPKSLKIFLARLRLFPGYRPIGHLV